MLQLLFQTFFFLPDTQNILPGKTSFLLHGSVLQLDFIEQLRIFCFLLLLFLQNLLMFPDYSFLLFFFKIRLFHLFLNQRTVSFDFLNLTFDLSSFGFQLSISPADFPNPGLCLRNIHLFCILSKLQFLKLFRQFCQIISFSISVFPISGNGFLHLHHIAFQRSHAGFQFFDLPPSSQKITAVSECSACHGTAGA